MSNIQWFPGHMHLTRKAMAERMPDTDVVIELLDARLPGSSANPLLAELTAGRPTLKILNKQDLADPDITAAWLTHYNALPGTRAIALDTHSPQVARSLIDACRALAPLRGGMVKPLRVLICGIPNVGKSTLLNTLKGQRLAKTGDEAGVTRTEQRVVLADDVYLYDTPGLLWPRIAVPESGVRLAASGAMGVNAYDDEVVALELLAYLKTHDPAALLARYKIADAGALQDEDLLTAIGRQRGAVQSGGRVQTDKAARILITDLRTGALGRISLETPEEFATWQTSAIARDAEKARLKTERKTQRPPR